MFCCCCVSDVGQHDEEVTSDTCWSRWCRQRYPWWRRLRHAVWRKRQGSVPYRLRRNHESRESVVVFTRDSRMLRASLPSSGRLSVCLSACLSHSWAVSKRCKLGSRKLHCMLPHTVYRDKTLCHWVQGFPSNEGVKEGYPLKKTSFCLPARSTQPSTLHGTVKWVVTHSHELRKVGTLAQLTGVA